MAKIEGPLSPIAERNRVAALSSRPHTAEEVKARRTMLATAKIDKAVREALDACPYSLNPDQTKYLSDLIKSKKD